MFQNTNAQKCTTLKNMVATLSAVAEDLFSVGNQRVPLFEALLEMLSGRYCCVMIWVVKCMRYRGRQPSRYRAIFRDGGITAPHVAQFHLHSSSLLQHDLARLVSARGPPASFPQNIRIRAPALASRSPSLGRKSCQAPGDPTVRKANAQLERSAGDCGGHVIEIMTG